jgi:predicted SAM-dependent methyltransferase
MKKVFQFIQSRFESFIPKRKKESISLNEFYLNDMHPKIHLGCGDIILNGWINIDARNADHIHIHTDQIDLKEFADNSVGVIYLSHVLEHFDFKESKDLLELFNKKLKPGGVLIVSVPDFHALTQVYSLNYDLEIVKRALMGGQDYAYNFHKSVYNFELLKNLLTKCQLGDFSTYRIENILISLSVIAIKK